MIHSIIHYKDLSTIFYVGISSLNNNKKIFKEEDDK